MAKNIKNLIAFVARVAGGLEPIARDQHSDEYRTGLDAWTPWNKNHQPMPGSLGLSLGLNTGLVNAGSISIIRDGNRVGWDPEKPNTWLSICIFDYESAERAQEVADLEDAPTIMVDDLPELSFIKDLERPIQGAPGFENSVKQFKNPVAVLCAPDDEGFWRNPEKQQRTQRSNNTPNYDVQ